MRHYAGQGAVRLIQADAKKGWMLLEQCIPGSSLASYQDERDKTSIAATVMQRLWRPVEHPEQFISLKRWLVGLKQLNEHAILKALLPETLRDFALNRSEELLLSQGEQVLLHGDLHHYNILQHQEAWLAIDPKGVVGEREFEIGAFLRNPWCVTGNPFDI
ncbi:MAG: aminoglycoside phosphotransferase family protein, partial [Methylococcales bacterium]|nr:aminoglycoside phosphotransferase family protein [Methylococcales bacterium]